MAPLLALWLPEFVVDVERRWEALPRDVPLVVGGAADGPGQVVAACAAARAAGVRAGQSLAAAAALVPSGRFLPGVLDRYAETASALDELVRRWCSEVEWVAIDRAVIPGSAIRGGAVTTTAHALRHAIEQELGLRSTIGVADTETAASVAAALVAPAGVLHVLPGYDARFLASLDVQWLPGLSAAARERLRVRGVATIGDLGDLLPADAEALLGPGGLAAWRGARGEDPRPRHPTPLPRSLTRALPLTAPVTSDDVQLAAEHLADQVGLRLSQIGAFAHALTVRVMGRDQRFRSRGFTLREATRQRADLVPVARTLAARLWRYGDPPVRVSVVVSGLVADGPQLSLFDLAPGDTVRAQARARLDGLRTGRSFRALARGSLTRRPRAS